MNPNSPHTKKPTRCLLLIKYCKNEWFSLYCLEPFSTLDDVQVFTDLFSWDESNANDPHYGKSNGCSVLINYCKIKFFFEYCLGTFRKEDDV